jgi:hypothetical protein
VTRAASTMRNMGNTMQLYALATARNASGSLLLGCRGGRIRAFCTHRRGPITPRLRRESPVLSGLLDGANVVFLALMAGVTWQLGWASVVGPIPALIALATLALLFVTKLNPAWLVIGGGAVGLASQYLLS